MRFSSSDFLAAIGVLVALFQMPSDVGAQNGSFAQLPLFYGGAEWIEDASGMFHYENSEVYDAMQHGCWMINERYEVPSSDVDKLLQGCYDRDGRLMAFPYDLEELARVKRADPRKVRGFDLFSHQSSQLEGGNPDPDGGDTLYVYDRDHAHIGTLTIDGKIEVQELFPGRVGQVVFEPHDAAVFMLEEDVYVAAAIARKELASNDQTYWMQAATIWKLDEQTKVFELVHLMDMDGMLNYDSIEVNNASMLDFFHFNEWSVQVVPTATGQRAIIGASARNNSNVFVFQLDQSEGQTAFALKHVLGNGFPVLSGISVPFTPTVEDDYPFMLQHGAAIYVDTASGTIYVASLNNGRGIVPEGSPNGRQPLSYGIWAIDTTMNTAIKVSSHVVKAGEDTLYGQFQGGCEFMPMADGSPLLVIYSGVDAYINAQGMLQLTAFDPELSLLLSNVSAFKLPPFNPTWEEVFRFKITHMTGTTVNRNLVTYAEPHMRPASISQLISFGHQLQSDRTMVWHSSQDCVWRVNTEEIIGDTLVLEGLWDIATLQAEVELWLPDSMYLWRAELWNTEPLILAGISDAGPEKTSSLVVFPVPAEDVLNIHLRSSDIEPTSIVVFDMQGRRIITMAATSGTVHTLDVSALGAGVYVVEASRREGIADRGRFVKQ